MVFAGFSEIERKHRSHVSDALRGFDRLKYRRVEWKCDSLNERSRSAAMRLGFKFEGIFRQHIIVKGRNRDTAWFSMLDSEWAAIKKNMEMWLYRNPDRQLSLTALNSSELFH